MVKIKKANHCKCSRGVRPSRKVEAGGEKGGVPILRKAVSEGLPEKGSFEQRLEESEEGGLSRQEDWLV